VVLRLPVSWQGEFFASRDSRLVDEPMRVPGKLSAAGWCLGGDDSSAIRMVLEDRDFSTALVRSPLSKGAYLSLASDYAAIEVTWSDDPKILEHCLDLLAVLAKACETIQKGNHG
jgi:hypothetical protein